MRHSQHTTLTLTFSALLFLSALATAQPPSPPPTQIQAKSLLPLLSSILSTSSSLPPSSYSSLPLIHSYLVRANTAVLQSGLVLSSSLSPGDKTVRLVEVWNGFGMLNIPEPRSSLSTLPISIYTLLLLLPSPTQPLSVQRTTGLVVSQSDILAVAKLAGRAQLNIDTLMSNSPYRKVQPVSGSGSTSEPKEP